MGIPPEKPPLPDAIPPGSLAGQVFDASPFATLLFTPDLVMVGCNATHARNSGKASDEIRGRRIFDVFPKNPGVDGPDTEDIIRESVARVVATGRPDEPPTQRHDLPTPDGGFERRYWRMIHSPVRNPSGDISLIRQDSWDVTATAAATERAAIERRTAQTAARMAFFELDAGRMRFVHSDRLGRLVGAPGDRLDTFEEFLAAVVPEDRATLAGFIRDNVENTEGRDEAVEFRSGGDGARVFTLHCERIANASGANLVGTVTDITHVRRNETALSKALEQKEALLDEVNHRVKNSLQLVSSILVIAAREDEDRKVTEKLLEAADRVSAIGSVHRALYDADRFGTVPLGEHLRSFCGQMVRGFGADKRGIAVTVDAADVDVTTDKAVAVTSIVNELLTNSLKHAFPHEPPDGTGTVRVALFPITNGLELTVEDNGIGAGTGTSEPGRYERGLGLRLVATLARQIGGHVHEEYRNGWKTRVGFPV